MVDDSEVQVELVEPDPHLEGTLLVDETVVQKAVRLREHVLCEELVYLCCPAPVDHGTCPQQVDRGHVFRETEGREVVGSSHLLAK